MSDHRISFIFPYSEKYETKIGLEAKNKNEKTEINKTTATRSP